MHTQEDLHESHAANWAGTQDPNAILDSLDDDEEDARYDYGADYRPTVRKPARLYTHYGRKRRLGRTKFVLLGTAVVLAGAAIGAAYISMPRIKEKLRRRSSQEHHEQGVLRAGIGQKPYNFTDQPEDLAMRAE